MSVQGFKAVCTYGVRRERKLLLRSRSDWRFDKALPTVATVFAFPEPKAGSDGSKDRCEIVAGAEVSDLHGGFQVFDFKA
jgi:hypothetical protein